MEQHELGMFSRLEREAKAGNYVMFRDDRTKFPWLGRYDPAVRRWVLVTPLTGSLLLTAEQLLAFGFSCYMRLGLDGLEPPP